MTAETVLKQSIYVPGCGSSSARLLILGEAPGEEEERQKTPFVGPTGKEVDSLLLAAGVHRNEVYLTNVFKYRPPNNEIKRASETGYTIEDGLPQLYSEIEAIRPNAILALGSTALQTLMGLEQIGKYRGSILYSQKTKCKVIPSIHPAAYLGHRGKKGGGAYKYLTRAYVQADFKRAVDESKTKEYNVPSRLLEVARSSAQVYRFIERYKEYSIAFMDTEAIHCVPVCIGFSFNSAHALSIPLRNAADWIANPVSDHELDQMWTLVDRILREKSIVAQNAKYDIEKLEALGFQVNYYADTSLMAHTLHPEFPKSLEFLTSIYTREPFYKNEYEDFVEKTHKMEDLMTYNCKDCCVLAEIFHALDENLKMLYG